MIPLEANPILAHTLEDDCSDIYLKLFSEFSRLEYDIEHPFDILPSFLSFVRISITDLCQHLSELSSKERYDLLERFGTMMLDRHSSVFFQALYESDSDLVEQWRSKLSSKEQTIINGLLSMTPAEAAIHDELLYNFQTGGSLGFDEGLLYCYIVNEMTTQRHNNPYAFQPILVPQVMGLSGHHKSQLGFETWSTQTVARLMQHLDANPDLLPEKQSLIFIFPGDHWLTVSVSRNENGVIDFLVLNSGYSADIEIEELTIQLESLGSVRELVTGGRMKSSIGCSYFSLLDAKITARIQHNLGKSVSDYLINVGSNTDGTVQPPYMFERYRQSRSLLRTFEASRDSPSESQMDYQVYYQQKHGKPHHPADRFEPHVGLDGTTRLTNTTMIKKIRRQREVISRFLRKHPEFLDPQNGRQRLKQALQQYHETNMHQLATQLDFSVEPPAVSVDKLT